MKDTDDSIKPSGDNDEKEELKEIVENLENTENDDNPEWDGTEGELVSL